MRKNFVIVLIAASLVLFSCKNGNAQDTTAAAPDAAIPKAEDVKPASKADVSYAFGVAIGTSLKQTAMSFDYKAFLNGIKDVLEKNKPNVTMEQANQVIQTAIMEAMKKKALASAAAEIKYLAENGKKTGITTTASGLQYEVVTMGNGAKPQTTDEITVHYTGKLTDGTTFDSSVERNEPATFVLGEVIPGWIEGLQLMPVGSKFKFYIPSSLAYGEQGAGDQIGPNETLVFDVELLSINAKE